MVYKGKPVAILTRDLQVNFEEKSPNRLYSDTLYKKHIMTKPSVLDRYLRYVEAKGLGGGGSAEYLD